MARPSPVAGMAVALTLHCLVMKGDQNRSADLAPLNLSIPFTQIRFIFRYYFRKIVPLDLSTQESIPYVFLARLEYIIALSWEPP